MAASKPAVACTPGAFASIVLRCSCAACLALLRRNDRTVFEKYTDDDIGYSCKKSYDRMYSRAEDTAALFQNTPSTDCTGNEKAASL